MTQQHPDPQDIVSVAWHIASQGQPVGSLADRRAALRRVASYRSMAMKVPAAWPVLPIAFGICTAIGQLQRFSLEWSLDVGLVLTLAYMALIAIVWAPAVFVAESSLRALGPGIRDPLLVPELTAVLQESQQFYDAWYKDKVAALVVAVLTDVLPQL